MSGKIWDMDSYGQYCPVARAAEVLGDRWTLLIVRDLLLGTTRFNDLARGLPGISRSLLAQRLQRLEQEDIVQRRTDGKGRTAEYCLTPAGQELQRVIDVLMDWGAQWAFGDPDPVELDPLLLLWWMRKRVHLERLPSPRMVMQFDFSGAKVGSYWLVLGPEDVSICLQHPGFDVDLLVTADIAGFYRVWLGRSTLAEALHRGWVRLEGVPALVRAFPALFAWSPAAPAVRAASARMSLAPMASL